MTWHALAALPRGFKGAVVEKQANEVLACS
jgi:hypothetical protein